MGPEKPLPTVSRSGPAKEVAGGLVFKLGPVCANCKQVLELRVNLDYFAGRLPKCAKCDQPINWWNVLVTMLQEAQSMQQSLALAGAQWTYFTIRIKPGENFHLDLSSYGVPADARLLSIGYTPVGAASLFPLEWHGNIPLRRPSMKTILIPIEITSKKEDIGPTEVAVLAAWLPALGDEEPWRDFVRALQSHVDGDYEALVIPASAAVESGISRLVKRVLLKHGSKERVEDFLINGATFSHQLNIVLPTIAALSGWPVLADTIRGQVNRLRELRNDLAHNGKLKTPLESAEAAQLLAAALLTHRYASLLMIQAQ